MLPQTALYTTILNKLYTYVLSNRNVDDAADNMTAKGLTDELTNRFKNL